MHVIHLITDLTWGGGARSAFDLCRRLSADGHRVTALIRRKAEELKTIIGSDDKIEIATIGSGGALDILSPIKLRKIIDQTDDKVILHAHDLAAAGIAAKARRLAQNPARLRVVCTLHNCESAPTDASHQQLYGEIDSLLFDSKLAFITFLSGKPAINPRIVRAVESAVRSDIVPLPHPTDDGQITLLYAGRVAPGRGIDTLINALAKTSRDDVRLRVCGTGRGRDVMPLVRLARSLEVDKRIDWLGFVDDIKAHLADTNIGVAPSVEKDSNCMAIKEMMASGMPVISSDSGAQREIITDGINGMIAPAVDAEWLARAIDTLAFDAALRHRLGEAAAVTASVCFNYDRYYDEIKSEYQI